MRLSELEPRWLNINRRRVGIIFKCPHCRTVYLTVFVEKLPIFGTSIGSQDDVIAKRVGRKHSHEVVHCDRDCQWTPNMPLKQATFETIGFTPSLDASRSGHWHGFITNGEIT